MKPQKLFKYISAFFFPCRCPFCGKVITPDEICCNQCSPKIKTNISKHFIGNSWLCTSPFKYTDLPKQAVLRLKFNDCGQIAPLMAEYMTASVKESFSDYSFDIVTFVPMHKKRKRKSLYNHSKLLAAEISKNLDVPIASLLVKTKNNSLQHRLPSQERIKNVKGVYSVNKKYGKTLKGKTVLLCDDVITTGSTLSECCKVLEKAGAKDVFCVAFSKA